MTVVVDASALLAFVQGENGAARVEEVLGAGAVCGAANWSEVAQKILAAGRDWDLVRALLLSYDLTVEPVDAELAEAAARSWARGSGLSLADRLCLACAARRGVGVLTADTAWSGRPGVEQIR